MKKIFTILGIVFMSSAFAQNYDIITAGSISDASKITQAYIGPLEKGFGYSGSNGIINFTKSKRKISFTFGMSITTALTPKDERTYDLNDLDLEEIEAADPNHSIAQTVSGTIETIEMQTKTRYYTPSLNPPFYKETPIAKFDSPEGINVPLSPYPIFTVGVYGYGTHVNFRYLPNFVPSDVGKVVFYGFSIQHNIDEFIPKLKEWPVHFAIATGYEKTSVDYYLDVQPDEGKFGLTIGSENGPYDNQKMEMEINSIPIQLVAYHDFAGITLYGGLGYNIINSTTAMKGNYPVYVTDPNDYFKLSVNDLVDPFEYSNNYNTIRFDAGMNYQIGFMKLMVSYSYSQYHVFHMGLGVRI